MSAEKAGPKRRSFRRFLFAVCFATFDEIMGERMAAEFGDVLER